MDDEKVTNDDAEFSIGDALEKAYDEMEKTDGLDSPAGSESLPASKPEAPSRDEVGRFAAKVAAPVTTPATTQLETVAEPIQAPNTWKVEAKAKFAALDPEVQQEIMRREKDVARTLTLHDQDRTFGKSLRDVVSPYMPMINAEGASPEAAIQSLLNTAYKLRTASPQDKARLFAGLAQQYGVDLSSMQPQDQPYIDPTVAQLQQELQQIKGVFSQQQTQQQLAEKQQALQMVDQFKADPANPHFDQVRDQMGALMQAGLAGSIKEAYEKAVYMHPEVRQKVLSEQQAEQQRKLIEEAKVKTEQAKKMAAVNLRSKPSLPARGIVGTMEQTMAERYDQLVGSA